jgi:glutamyl-tRNA reductase
VNDLRVIAITHKNFPLETVGRFHLSPENRKDVLQGVKNKFNISELIYLSTCNRVELVFSLPHFVCPGITAQVLKELQPSLTEEECRGIALSTERYNGPEAARHMLEVASSMDSVVIGEREIITQLRKAYEDSNADGLTGDDMRLLISQCLKTAKEIFTHTDLARKPVSVVSLAWQQFLSYGLKQDARILLVGAGQIIRNFTKFLFENGYTNITIANRSIQRAEELVKNFGGRAFLLEELSSFTEGFDALVTCTASENALITEPLYDLLLAGDTTQKLVIDLALPADVEATIADKYAVRYVGMAQIQKQASENIRFREQALEECKPIINSGIREFEKVFQARQIERAMQSIPETIKEIRSTALGSVFAKDLEHLDENSRELLEKIMSYMEKKYISIPMKMAREVLMNEVGKN